MIPVVVLICLLKAESAVAFVWRAKDGEFPFVASVVSRDNQALRTDGAVITNLFVLTSCVPFTFKGSAPLFERPYAVAGSIHYSLPGSKQFPTAQWRDVPAVHIHPTCKSYEWREPFFGFPNDHALAQLNEPFQLNDYIQPFEPPMKSLKLFKKYGYGEKFEKAALEALMGKVRRKEQCTAVGWQTFNVVASLIALVPSQTCNTELCESFSSTLNMSDPCDINTLGNFQVCAHNISASDGKIDFCFENPGSLLVCNGAEVHGVLSFGLGCVVNLTFTMPRVYSSIAPSWHWIGQVVGLAHTFIPKAVPLYKQISRLWDFV